MTVDESQMGKRQACPRCKAVFLAGASQPMAADLKPVEDDIPHAQVLEDTGAAIRYSCPRCKKPLEDAASEAGVKKPCPHCGQRVQVPAAKSVPPLPSAPVYPAASAVAEVIPQGIPVGIPSPEAPTRKQRCLECGRDLRGFAKTLTCPACGSVFCSSLCIRDHDAYAHDRRRR